MTKFARLMVDKSRHLVVVDAFFFYSALSYHTLIS